MFFHNAFEQIWLGKAIPIRFPTHADFFAGCLSIVPATSNFQLVASSDSYSTILGQRTRSGTARTRLPYRAVYYEKRAALYQRQPPSPKPTCPFFGKWRFYGQSLMITLWQFRVCSIRDTTLSFLISPQALGPLVLSFLRQYWPCWRLQAVQNAEVWLCDIPKWGSPCIAHSCRPPGHA